MMNHQNKANMHVNILWITLGEKIKASIDLDI